jgi:hypothetical protein
MFYTAQSAYTSQQTSKIYIEWPQYTKNSIRTTHFSTSSNKSIEANYVIDDAIQNQSQINNQADLMVTLENITRPKVCAVHWREEVITLEEAVQCVHKYMQERKSFNYTPDNGGEV